MNGPNLTSQQYRNKIVNVRLPWTVLIYHYKEMSNTVAPFCDSRTVSLASLKRLVLDLSTLFFKREPFQGGMLQQKRSLDFFQNKSSFISDDRPESQDQIFMDT